MAKIQVILQGAARISVHDTYDYPLVLQFGDQTSYDRATWFIPSAGRFPAWRLSEIRVEEGSLSILVDGPEGFRSGPHDADWVRSHYPRGKDCAFIRVNRESKAMGGVTLTAIEGILVVDEMAAPGATPPAA